jgi:hypothetical protein
MTFTTTPPDRPGFYAWRRNSESPITLAVVVENSESWRAGAIPVEHCHLNGGEWCRLVPAEELSESWREGRSSVFSSKGLEIDWEASRTKRVMEGRE